MKLFYLDFPNVGDQLNPWLWNRLLPGILDDDEQVRLVGIGTLLNRKLHQRLSGAKRFVVFGTGVGYVRGGLPLIDESWNIYCVRGPLSAEALGLPKQLGITDPGLLVNKYYVSDGVKQFKYSYMPHVDQANSSGVSLQRICDEIGFNYIDPRLSVDAVLDAISKTHVLLAEAMHGAIFADALRVPWVPVVSATNILEFKWVDWCTSVNLQFAPYKLSVPRALSEKLRTLYFGFPKNSNLYEKLITDPKTGVSPWSYNNHWLDMKMIGAQLKNIARSAMPILSDKRISASLCAQLEVNLELMKADYMSGRLNST